MQNISVTDWLIFLLFPPWIIFKKMIKPSHTQPESPETALGVNK